MLFDMTANTNARKLMILDSNYPQDVTTTVIKGNTVDATFTVKIAEHGKPAEYTYQWYVNDLAVSGANSDTFTLTGLGETVTSTIYCDVTNKKGTLRTRTATLNVEQFYTPVLDGSYPANTTVYANTDVTSTVVIETEGNPAEYSYQWYKNGLAVEGATDDSYTFAPTDLGKTELYCVVSNSAGKVTSRTAVITANRLYLYNKGDQCKEVTGGWTGSGYSISGGDLRNATLGSTKIEFSGKDGYFTGRGTNKAINVANAKTLTIKGNLISHSSASGESRGFVFSVSTAKTNVGNSTAVLRNATNGTFTKTIDLSKVSKDQYICLYVYGNDGIEGTVSEVYLT